MSKHPTRRTWLDRLLAGVLCLALTLGLMPVTGLFQTAEAHWADSYADKLEEWGVLPAEWKWSKNLDATVKRAEFVAMCNRAFGYTKLGEMPFVDVNVGDWYYEEINIAYNAGYFSGDSDDPSMPKASPEGTLTREQAIVAVAVNLMLQQTVGESLGFTDSHRLSFWSRNWVGAAVAEGVVSGYPDGTFRPQSKIKRGELVTLLVGLIGTPISQEGSYKLGDIYGNVVISSSHVTLRDTVILGNLYITGGVDLGSVLLENVTVLGRIVVAGGGVSEAAQSSVILRNVVADELVIDSLVDQPVTVSAYGLTQIPNTYVRYEAFLEDSCAEGYGLQHIELDGKPGTKLQIAGSIKEVVNKTPRSSLQLVRGTAKTITVDEEAKGSELLVDINTRADVVNLDTACYVYGKGDILYLNIWDEICEIALLPEHIDIRAGLMAVLIDGDERREIGSTDANELSQEPRLLSGYPSVDSSTLRPTSAEGLYAGNKPGTIYWAVSAVANGSVVEKDLLKNPAYGGNIYEGNSGSITVTSRGSEYSRLISELESGGSYYISAILVDERGNRSPVKVISFTTPDDSTPEFVEEPHMTKVSCDIAQVTTMVNKNCQLYWVLLRAGSTAPTPRNFQTGSFGGHYGYGAIPVAKNVPISLQVNSGRLQEQTGYDLYLWLSDGTHSSAVVKVLNEDKKPKEPSFITPDQTPPVVSNVRQSKYLDEAIEFTFEVNEAPATLYWYVVAETDDTLDKMAAERRLRTVVDGVSPVISGSKAVTKAKTTTTVASGDFKNALKFSDWGTHNFKLYYVAEDADGNFSEVGVLIIHTADTDEPTVEIRFPENKMLGQKPQADADIMLVFSEQVKGVADVDAETFLDLYNDVVQWAAMGLEDRPGTRLAEAKDKLGEELAKHITMHHVDGRYQGDGKDPMVPGRPENEEDEELCGWIDFREATLALQTDGSMVLTLPANKAVKMGGGIEYYFYFVDIYDGSHTPNALKLTRADGTTDGGRKKGINDPTCYTDTFTTVYALVWLSEDTDLSDTTVTIDGKKITLDKVIRVEPQSTSKTAGNDYWDMVIWNDTASTSHIGIDVVIYRSEDGETWEAVTGETHITRTMAMSLNGNKLSDDKYETIADGLVQGKTYFYGIHFTQINGETDPEAWSADLTLHISLVAGGRTSVSRLNNGGVAGQYRNLVYGENGQEPELSEIGSADKGGMILEITPWFKDKRPPAFEQESPTFTASSSSISMDIHLNRTGMVYYLVIPASALNPSFTDMVGGKQATVRVTPDNDGRTINGGVTPPSGANSAAALEEYFKTKDNKKTYIPLSGADREDNGKYIYFVSGGGADEPSETGYKYNNPKPDEIWLGTYAEEEHSVAGSFPYTRTSNQTVPLDGGTGRSDLLPDTWYYVYILLRSESSASDSDSKYDTVQVYRVKTKETEPPTITITPNGSSGVTMTVNDRTTKALYDNPVLTYVRVWQDVLPDWCNQYYIWADGLKDAKDSSYGPFDTENEAKAAVTTLQGKNVEVSNSDIRTVLDAMLNKSGSTWLSYFDKFAPDALKDTVMQYITISTSSTNKSRFGPFKENTKTTGDEFTKGMEYGSKYIVLACARYDDDNLADTGAEYGFAAAVNLEVKDETPPELTSPSIPTSGSKPQTVNITAAYNPNGGIDGLWSSRDSLAGYTFDGTVRFTFRNKIYTHHDGVLKQIVGKISDDGGKGYNDKQVTMAYLLGVTGTLGQNDSGIVSVTATNSDRTFEIKFQRLNSSYSVSLGDIRNVSDVPSPNTLTLKFRPETRIADYDPDSWTGSIWEPCFIVEWQ